MVAVGAEAMDEIGIGVVQFSGEVFLVEIALVAIAIGAQQITGDVDGAPCG